MNLEKVNKLLGSESFQFLTMSKVNADQCRYSFSGLGDSFYTLDFLRGGKGKFSTQ